MDCGAAGIIFFLMALMQYLYQWPSPRDQHTLICSNHSYFCGFTLGLSLHFVPRPISKGCASNTGRTKKKSNDADANAFKRLLIIVILLTSRSIFIDIYCIHRILDSGNRERWALLRGFNKHALRFETRLVLDFRFFNFFNFRFYLIWWFWNVIYVCYDMYWICGQHRICIGYGIINDIRCDIRCGISETRNDNAWCWPSDPCSLDWIFSFFTFSVFFFCYFFGIFHVCP